MISSNSKVNGDTDDQQASERSQSKDAPVLAKVTDDVRLETARVVYRQIYDANNSTRDRMAKIFTGAIGVAVAANGWAILLVSKDAFEQKLRAPLLSTVLAIFSVAMYSIISHYREYCVGARMIVRLEKAMGFYEDSLYLKGSTLYERQHMKWGSGSFSSHILRYYVISILLFAVLSAVLLVFLPAKGVP